MKILIIGLGSMGRRRIRLLLKINPELKMIGVDNNKERCIRANTEFGIQTCSDLDSLLSTQAADAAVIATSPLSHGRLIQQCLKSNLHVFTELNLVPDYYSENMELAEKSGRVLFLSSTFLYRDEIKYIRNRVCRQKGKVNYVYHIGQYLPDWHPWENYKDFFVGDKRTNGCREIFAIELPWLRKTFGEIVSFYAVKDKNTLLDIDYPDSYHLILSHSSGITGSVAVDVMSRKAVRNIEIYGEDIFLSWDGSPAGLKEYDLSEKCDKTITLYHDIDKLQGYGSFIVENAYKNELMCFLDVIEGKAVPEYTFHDDMITLKLIDEIEGN